MYILHFRINIEIYYVLISKSVLFGTCHNKTHNDVLLMLTHIFFICTYIRQQILSNEFYNINYLQNETQQVKGLD